MKLIVPALLGAAMLSLAVHAQAPAPQGPPPQTPPPQAPTPPDAASRPPQKPQPPVERLSDTLLRIGNVRIDTKRREISVPGTVNDVAILEFLANTKGGFKAYESVLTLETDAITFNLACVLIGLDRANAVPPERHFDERTPIGDPVEIHVSWTSNGKTRRVRGEELLYSKLKRATMPETHWVYTGSTFYPEGQGYMADVDGVLIGFVHSPAPVIENPLSLGVGNYGSMIINPALKLAPGTSVTLTVRALNRTKSRGATR